MTLLNTDVFANYTYRTYERAIYYWETLKHWNSESKFSNIL